MIIDIGLWKLDIDVEGTKSYYEQLTVEDKDPQSCQNYRAYCKIMRPEEKTFFDQLGIMPEKCNVGCIGITKAGYYPTYGEYLIKGRYINIPEEHFMSIEDFLKQQKEKSMEKEDVKGTDIKIGNFKFQFLWKDSMFHPEPEDVPEGSICMGFFADDLPWILDEKPLREMYELPKWWEINKKIKEYRNNKKANIEAEKAALAAVEQDLKKQHIPYQIMSVKQVKAFKKHWFNTFAPKENRDKGKKVCFPYKGYGNYLWHLFSYEYANRLENKEAVTQYHNQEKKDCYLLLNFYDIGIKLKHADRYQWHLADCYMDVIITDKNFKWTFAHTHEENCGPYFAIEYGLPFKSKLDPPNTVTEEVVKE